ncbi:replication initiator protein [Apis mellifera associated microvirus 49]|nr:replication initiator protein [Apis mellifera associated microvirus 49]
MICKKPFVKGGAAYGCGQCLPCRINRRRLWTHRILLESLCHTDNCFVTLTYAEPKPSISGEKSSNTWLQLNPKDLSDWLKRYREKIYPSRLRFFGVGEYGDATFRPHYHVCLFGVAGCARGRTKRVFGSTRSDWYNCCPACRAIGETWGLGDIEIGELNPKTAAYVAEYTVKKMTRFDDPRLQGRHPEFARMSLRPGIGNDAMWQVASDMFRWRLEDRDDVPNALAHGKMQYPLGRYLMRVLRKRVGKDEKAPTATLEKIKAELQPLREAAFNASRSLSSAIAEASEQPVRNIEAKMNIHKRRVI